MKKLYTIQFTKVGNQVNIDVTEADVVSFDDKKVKALKNKGTNPEDGISLEVHRPFLDKIHVMPYDSPTEGIVIIAHTLNHAIIPLLRNEMIAHVEDSIRDAKNELKKIEVSLDDLRKQYTVA